MVDVRASLVHSSGAMERLWFWSMIFIVEYIGSRRVPKSHDLVQKPPCLPFPCIRICLLKTLTVRKKTRRGRGDGSSRAIQEKGNFNEVVIGVHVEVVIATHVRVMCLLFTKKKEWCACKSSWKWTAMTRRGTSTKIITSLGAQRK